MPCGFQTRSDNSLRNRTWAGRFKSPHWLSCFEFALWEQSFTPAWETAQGFRSVVLLFRLHDAGRLPCAFTGRQDGSRLRLRRVDQVTVDRVFDQELALAVIHCDRPEGVHRRVLPCGEGKGVLMLAAVERFAIGQGLGHGIHGLDRVVPVDAGLGGGGSLEPVAVVKSAVAKERTDFPAVNVLLSGLEILLDLGFTFLYARDHLCLLFWREVFESEFLSRFDAEAGQLFSYFLLLRFGGSELKREGEVVKEAGLNHFFINLGEINGRWCRWRGLFQILGERLNFVASLNLDHIRHVLRVKELGAVGYRRELGARPEYLLDAWRRLAFPVGPGHHVIAGLVAGGAAADVTIIVGISVAKHDREVARFLHRGDREDDRFGAQVRPQDGIWRVAVRGDNRCVFVGEDASFVVNLIERRFVLTGVLVHRVFVHDRVVHHDRQTVDEPF